MRWNRFWYRPASPIGIIVARVFVALNALWIVLSRSELPRLLAWPRPFWAGTRPAIRVRFFYGLPQAAESILYVVLCAALLLVAFGVSTRVMAFVAGVLLYHFAPLENIIAAGAGPFFNGLTLPTLALLILSFANLPVSRRDAASPEYRWPLALIQVLFIFTYLFAGLSKIRRSGLGWVTADNIRSTIEVFNAYEPAYRRLAHYLITHPALCGAIGTMTIVFELTLIIILFFPRTAVLIVPLLGAAHVGIFLTLGVVFLNIPLLALFLDWDALTRRKSSSYSANISNVS